MNNTITLSHGKGKEKVEQDFSVEHALNMFRMYGVKGSGWTIVSKEWIFKDNELSRSPRNSKEKSSSPK